MKPVKLNTVRAKKLLAKMADFLEKEREKHRKDKAKGTAMIRIIRNREGR